MPFKKGKIKHTDNKKIVDKWESSHIVGCE